MDNEWVTVTEKYFRQPDGKVLVEIWVGEQMLHQAISANWWIKVMRPYFWIPQQDPWSAVSCIDGSCIVTALVKEGPKAMVLYGR